MELFSKANAVKLLGHHDMFLVADEDQKTIRQSRKGYSRLAIWTVETVIGKPNLIRLRSCHGTYLTASSKLFLFGMTGEKVTQTQSSNNPMDCQTHWEPEGVGVTVKLKSWCGKWMRANGGTPPWRKSVTHDEPPTSKTKNWLLWYVITVDGFDPENISDGYKSSLSSPASPHLPGLGFWSAPGSPVSGRPKKSLGRFASLGLRSVSPRWSPKLNKSIFKQKERMCSFNEKETVSAVEFFRKAKAVRMRSCHNKYLTADEDEETVSQGKNGSTENAQWTVEPVHHSHHVIRLKSCYGKYLTASNERFLLGATGKKVIQLKPSRLDSTVEWEPVREGSKILLKTRYGNYLRANDGPPPRRKSITHDNPYSATLESISWELDVVEILINPQSMEEMEHPSPRKSLTPPPHRKPSNFQLSVSHSMAPSSLSYISNSESDESPPKAHQFIPSSKKTLHSPPHRKPSTNPFSLSDKSDSDCDEFLPQSNELTNNHHINHPFNEVMQSTPSYKQTMHPSPHKKLPNSLHFKTLFSLLDESDSACDGSPSKKTLHSPPQRKLSNSPHSKTPSSLLDISNKNFDESPLKRDELTIGYHSNQPLKTERKYTPSSKKMMHLSAHRKQPSNSHHSKTPSFLFDKSESDSDESPMKLDERTIVYPINPSFKAEMKSTSSSKKILHWKLSSSPHSKTSSSLSETSNSNSDESASQLDEISYHINHPFKVEMKYTSSSKKTVHLSPHRNPSNSPHTETPSYHFDRSDSDSDESSSKSDGQTINYHINPPLKGVMKSTLSSKKTSSKKTLHPPEHRKLSNSPRSKTPSSLSDISDSDCEESTSKSDGQTINYPQFKKAMKSTLSSKKKMHPLPHRKLSNSPHLKTPSFLSDISDSECDESPSKPDRRTLDYHTDLPFKAEMKSTPSSKKKMYKKLSNSPHSKTSSSLPDNSDSESDESPSKVDGQTVDYHINPPHKVAKNSISSSKKMLHLQPHKKPSSVRTPCSISDNTNCVETPLKQDGRTIYYSIADKRHMEDKSTGGYVFTFKGNSVAELTEHH